MSADLDTSPAPVAVPASILGVLRALVRRQLALAWTSGAARILALLLALGLARCLFDLWLQLDWPLRLVFLVLDLAIAAWLAHRWCWLPWKQRLSTERAALRLERVFSVLGSRLIAAVQLPAQVARDKLSPELVGGVVREAETTLATLPWREAAPARAAGRGAALLALVLLVAGGLAALRPEAAAVLARRWLLSTEPALTRTRLVLAQENLRVAAGSSLTLAARAEGVVPRGAVFELRPASGEPRDFPREAAADTPGEFSLPISSVRENFRYRVRAGDARSSWHEVEVLPAPVLKNIAWRLRPPAYTGQPERALEPDGEIVAPEGSMLLVRGAADLPLRSASLARWPADAAAEASLQPLALAGDARGFSGEIALDASVASVGVPLVSRDGVASQDDTRRPVRLLPDAAPTLTLRAAPADGDSATASDALLIAALAADDHGLASAELRWEVSVADGSPTPGSHPLLREESGSAPRRAEFALRLVVGASADTDPALVPVAAPPGAKLVWWIEAADNSPSAQRAATPRRTVRIVTADERLAELMTRLREGMGELDDVSRSIERANDQLRRLLPAETPATP